MKVVKLVKQYHNVHCPICNAQLKNRWQAKVTIPLEMNICTNCANERKEFLFWLQDHLPAHMGDIKNLGIPTTWLRT